MASGGGDITGDTCTDERPPRLVTLITWAWPRPLGTARPGSRDPIQVVSSGSRPIRARDRARSTEKSKSQLPAPRKGPLRTGAEAAGRQPITRRAQAPPRVRNRRERRPAITQATAFRAWRSPLRARLRRPTDPWVPPAGARRQGINMRSASAIDRATRSDRHMLESRPGELSRRRCRVLRFRRDLRQASMPWFAIEASLDASTVRKTSRTGYIDFAISDGQDKTAAGTSCRSITRLTP